MIQHINQREFGFSFGKNYFRRKLTFNNVAQLKHYIKVNNPLDCYICIAFFENPAKMQGWQGAELFYDFDNENLRRAYADALTTYQVLLNDFALEQVEILFSGNKGYHVVAHDDIIKELGRSERKEIVEYLQGRYKVKSLDVAASCDVKRLRRLPGTKNSKSGMLCRRVILSSD